ncbi:glycosyltransferase family 9 protein [Azospirillum sp.]|uniref:glycosyltransferase family 9 protein n=1 Tax=Azospirillum sp. TaxID=34012 RepID=UPI003D722FC8
MDSTAALHAAVARHREGRLAEAGRLYRRVLADDPVQADALQLLGLVARAAGMADDAARLMRRCLRIAPLHVGTLLNLARQAVERDQCVAAIRPLAAATAVQPERGDAEALLGRVLLRSERCDHAACMLRRACRLMPDNADTRHALSVALNHNMVAAFDEALRHAVAAVALAPGNAAHHLQLAFVRSELGEHHRANADARRALAIDPTLDWAKHALGIGLLSLGHLREGLAFYEHRLSNIGFRGTLPQLHPWDGRPLPDGTLLLHAEGGFGDSIQFLRYATAAARLCREVVVVCPKPLERLLAAAPGAEAIVFNPPEMPQAGAKALFLSLPHLFGGRPETIPRDTPYLRTDPALVDRWAERLRGVDGLRIGVCWSNGTPSRPADPRRSAPVSQVLRLADVPGVRLVSLHVADSPDKRVPPTHAGRILQFDDLDQGPHALTDTAALMMNLDLVVTIDTAVAHLAGALGRPVWLALANRACWRWMDDRETTCWYPTMRIVRQERPRDWDEVFTRIAAALRREATGRRGEARK